MATEKWLIDANKFKHKMKLEFLDRRNKFISMNDLFECIDDMPTVDAVEVVHGRWIHKEFEDEDWGGVWSKWTCFNCGHSVGINPNGYNYCHNCGAKMDGGVQNGL